LSASTRPERIVAVVGPTASGKTALAEAMALALDAEIISADSMQVYRGMDIGTAKPRAPHPVPYHCIDLCDPGTPYSAALFQRDARRAIALIAGRDRTPLVSGGTGLYVRAALDDWHIPAGNANTDTRRRLEDDLEREGAHALHERLGRVDPEAAALIHPNNARRTIRALEMAEEGLSYATQARGFSRRSAVYDVTFIGLHMDRQLLYARIEERVDRMVQGGLLEEVEVLLQQGFRDALTATQAIGYKEFVPVVDGLREVESATREVKQATRRYAKRQLSWFRSDPRIQWLDVTSIRPEQALEEVLELLSSD
jgi:tRNA dimethylallyltransferase